MFYGLALYISEVSLTYVLYAEYRRICVIKQFFQSNTIFLFNIIIINIRLLHVPAH
jgi:hypothetical protein